MSVATIKEFYIPGNSSVYLAAYPAAGFTGATNAEKLEAVYALFYEDGGIRKAIKSGVKKWANLKEGITVSIKGKPIEVKPQGLGKKIVGYDSLEVEAEGSFYDIDGDHIEDIFSSSFTLDTAAAAGQAAKKDTAGGSATVPNKYVLMVEVSSPDYTGEFNQFLLPQVVFMQDTKLSFKDGETLEMGFKINAQYDSSFIDPVTKKAVVYWYGDTVGAALP